MFGYVKTCTPQLRPVRMGSLPGHLLRAVPHPGAALWAAGRLTLSYDFTFYATLEMALREEVPEFRRRSCGVNPLRRCRHCEENEALNRAADMAILSLWYKAADTIGDGGFFGPVRAAGCCGHGCGGSTGRWQIITPRRTRYLPGRWTASERWRPPGIPTWTSCASRPPK